MPRVIQTNVMGASDAVRFQIVSGGLPQGVTPYENGKLYGVPMESGSFTFTVEAEFTRSGRTETKQFTLTVLDNTDANVEGSTDMGYELLDRVPAELTLMRTRCSALRHLRRVLQVLSGRP